MKEKNIITRKEMTQTLIDKMELSKNEAVEILEDVFNGISIGLSRDGKVKLPRFGTFHIREKDNRIGRNPKTGEKSIIKARKCLLFKASSLLKKNVLNGNSKKGNTL